MAKIYVQLADSLYLRKIDAQKEYLSLSGGTLTGDATLDDSSLYLKKNSNVSKFSQNSNNNLDIYSDKNIQFSTNGSTYFVANPSYISLENKHNNVSVELVNEDGSGSPYGGLTIYSTKNGAPEMTSAISSGYMNGTPFQEKRPPFSTVKSWYGVPFI